MVPILILLHYFIFSVNAKTLSIPLNELALSIPDLCSPPPPHLNKYQNHSKIITDKIAKLQRAFVHLKKAELSYSFLAPGQ